MAPQRNNTGGTASTSSAPGSGQLDYTDDSPYLDFSVDGLLDDTPNYADGKMFADLPDDDEDDEGDSNEETNDLHDKRKSMGDGDDDDEGGGKRREGEDRTAKKPGRKPLTSEPTTKRKAQNRAAQRAFRERKEKHLKDLETTVEDLKKASEAANHENGLLKAQIERMQVELKEYRKRIAWISSNGSGRQSSVTNPQQRSATVSNTQSDFSFQFPKFGDVPVPGLFGDGTRKTSQPQTQSQRQASVTSASPAASTTSRTSMTPNFGNQTTQRSASMGDSSANKNVSASPAAITGLEPQSKTNNNNNIDSFSGLFSPSILEATRQSPNGYFGLDNNSNNNINNLNNSNNQNGAANRSSFDNSYSSVPGLYSGSSIGTTESPGSSADSHQPLSSIGTSPDPMFNSPNPKLQDLGLNTINENTIFDANAWNINSNFSTEFDTNGFNFLAQQNGGGFDPILFGDYRESQDNVLSQDFGSFFNDAYPLPDLGSPTHNFGDVNNPQGGDTIKGDLMQKVEKAQNAEPPKAGEAPKMMTCNKIWDRLQSMEKFRNGEIDIDNLCSELRAKAKCSEGGAVVDEKHVNKILGL